MGAGAMEVSDNCTARAMGVLGLLIGKISPFAVDVSIPSCGICALCFPDFMGHNDDGGESRRHALDASCGCLPLSCA